MSSVMPLERDGATVWLDFRRTYDAGCHPELMSTPA